MKLIQTNAVFSRMPWCLVFVQKIDFREKSRKIYQMSYFPRRLTEPEGQERKAPEWARQDPGAGPGLAAPGWRLAASGTFSASFFAYMTYVTRNTEGVQSFSQNKSAAPPPETLFRGPGTPFWHPVGTGKRRRSSPSSSPTPLHQPSMIPPAMGE